VQDTKLCSGTSQNLTTKKHMVWHYPFSYIAHFS